VVLGVVAVLAGLLLAVARLGGNLNDAAQARTAADAAALAGVHGGRAQAEALAQANGAVLTRFEVIGHDIVVAVAVGSAAATARATDAVEQSELSRQSRAVRTARRPG